MNNMTFIKDEDDLESTDKLSDRRPFTTTEKILFVAATLGVTIFIAILVNLKGMTVNDNNYHENFRVNNTDKDINGSNEVKEICHEFCWTPICQKEAASLKKNMNLHIDPCDDFYQFACGNFIKNAIIPADENKIDMLSITQKKVMTELKDEIKDRIKENDLNAFQKLKIYYQNCINTTRIQEDGTNTLLQIINDTGGWPLLLGNKWKEDTYDWLNTTYKLINYGYPLLFPVIFTIRIDPKNTTRYIINLLNAHTRIQKVYFFDGLNSKIIKAYYDYMVDIAVMLGADENVALIEMKNVLDFETELYRLKSKSKKWEDFRMTLKDFGKHFPSIPWLELINTIFKPSGTTIDEDETILIDDPKFINELEKLIGRTSNRIITNYIIWQAIFASVDYLPDDFLDRQLRFAGAVSGVKERKDKTFTCIDDIMQGFSISLSALYVRKYFNRELRKSALDLVYDIKNQFRKMLEEVDWMDWQTKIAALEKIDAMNVFVAYSNELLDDQEIDEYYKNLDISYGSYLKSGLNISLFIINQDLQRLKNIVDKKDWRLIENAAVIDAYYYVQKNTFEIPAGLLRGSFFHSSRPKYMNYGALGSIIGHEITHGFDNMGRKSDKDGNSVDWWQKKTEDKYLQRVNCIIEQYSNYTVKEIGLKLNGTQTQSEDIADNGGYRAAYRAYVEWANRGGGIKEPCLPELNYSARQMFWISTAGNWCRKQKIEYLRETISTDPHSPFETRVTVPFSNMREFAEDFACKLGSRMNPVKKCIVW